MPYRYAATGLVGHHDRVSQPQDSGAGSGNAEGQAATPDQPWPPTSAPHPGYGTTGATAGSGYTQPGQPGYGGYGQASSGASGQQPYSPSGQQPYSPSGQQPYSSSGQQPYNSSGQQPYSSSGQPGYGGYGQQPYAAPDPQSGGYGAPSGQAYPSYPQQSGYGQRYPTYGAQATAKDPALAEWWRRLLARVIDGAILAIVFSPLWIPPWHAFFHTFRLISNSYPAGTQIMNVPAAKNAIVHAEGTLIGGLFVVLLLFYLAAFLYDWVQHAAWGQTLGKRAVGTIVVTADGHGKVRTGAAAGRAAIYALTPLVPFVGGLFDLLNELWLLWDGRRQCLHDKAAHTVVIKKDYQGPPMRAGGW